MTPEKTEPSAGKPAAAVVAKRRPAPLKVPSARVDAGPGAALAVRSAEAVAPRTAGATHTIQTVIEPWKTITVDDTEYAELLRLGLVYSGSPVAPVADGTDLQFADKIVHGVATPAALKAAYVSPLPTAGSLTYNGDGTVASDPDGNTYTWNTDGTPATQTKGGITRTFHWNTDGTLASVS